MQGWGEARPAGSSPTHAAMQRRFQAPVLHAGLASPPPARCHLWAGPTVSGGRAGPLRSGAGLGSANPRPAAPRPSPGPGRAAGSPRPGAAGGRGRQSGSGAAPWPAWPAKSCPCRGTCPAGCGGSRPCRMSGCVREAPRGVRNDEGLRVWEARRARGSLRACGTPRGAARGWAVWPGGAPGRIRSARSVRASKTRQRGSVFGRRLFCFPGAGTRLPSAPAVSAELRCACAGRERMAAERCWHGSARSRPRAGAAFAGLQRDPAWIAVLLLLLSVTHASLLPGERRSLRSLQSGP